MKHRKKDPGSQGVQLGLIITPMLDMSFQILAFFIMTYNPSALEGHIPGSLVPPENYAKKSADPFEATWMRADTKQLGPFGSDRAAIVGFGPPERAQGRRDAALMAGGPGLERGVGGIGRLRHSGTGAGEGIRSLPGLPRWPLA